MVSEFAPFVDDFLRTSPGTPLQAFGECGHARLESTVASDLSEHASGLARAETGHARVVTLRKDVMSAFEPDPSLIKRMPLT